MYFVKLHYNMCSMVEATPQLVDFESWEPNNAQCLYVNSDQMGEYLNKKFIHDSQSLNNKHTFIN
jgi:hypothetical protein